MNSAETSGRLVFSDDASQVKPATDDLGFPNSFKSRGKRSDYGNDEEKEETEVPELEGPGIRRYGYGELHEATQGFSDACLLVKEMSGDVYKGMLKGQGAVAIKVLSRALAHGSNSHTTKIKVWSRLRHRNVLQLLGCCRHAGQLLLVYEFSPNGSLAFCPSLPWKVRYWKVAVGLASALLYLQEGLDCLVVHTIINPGKILLDSDFNPKLAAFDFSMVADCSETGFTTTDLAWSLRYLDPQYAYTGKPNESSIYALGVIALQLASGRKVIDYSEEYILLPAQVMHLRKEGILLEAADPELTNEFDKREMERLLLVGLWCTQDDPKSRPSVRIVHQLLNFEVPMPTNFTGDVFSTSTKHEIRSSRNITPEESEVIHTEADIDAANTSVKGRAERDKFDELSSSVLVPNNQEDEPTPALSTEHAMFDIGIPSDFTLPEFKNHRKDHHRYILKGLVGSLGEMMQSEENLPRFDEALEKIKMYTAFLVQEIGPPLDDWDTLAQLILQSLKEREDFFKFCADLTSLIHDVALLSLNADMHKCAHTIYEDRRKLKDCKELLAHAQEKCASLEAELAKAREIAFSAKEQIKVVAQQITENLSSLERGGHYALLKQHENVLSKLSSFIC